MNNEMMKEIKELVEKNYGFTPEEAEINEIDSKLILMNDDYQKYRIVNRIGTRSIMAPLDKHKDELGKFDAIIKEKLIFNFLNLAISCFNEANNYASICLCRVAIESGLIERVAEEAKKIRIIELAVTHQIIKRRF